MTDTRSVHAHGPADLLALTPGLLGFHPVDSVVLLTVGAARAPFHARVDLPTDPVGVEDLVTYLSDVAARNGVRRLAALIYSDDSGLAETLVGALEERLHRRRVDLVCAVRADGERWWPVAEGADLPGTPYDVSSHPLMAQAVVAGTVVLGSRHELADTLVGTDLEEIDRVSALAEDAALRLDALLAAPLGPTTARRQLAIEGRWVRHRVCRFLDDGMRLDAHDVARLVTLMAASVEVRDVAWAEMTHHNAARHVDLWRDVVRRSPADLRAAAAALLGFAAWLSGNGALAWCAVECSQEAEPGYSLAGLLTDALAGAVPPSAWRPIPREALTLFGA